MSSRIIPDDGSFFMKHLYYESHPKSKVYHHHKCIEILEKIAMVKDRNETIKSLCLKIYGKDTKGNILCRSYEQEQYIWNTKVIERLKRMYNRRLSMITEFKLPKRCKACNRKFDTTEVASGYFCCIACESGY